MKKTIFVLVIIAIIGGCFTTSTLSATEITGIRGGYGVIATVVEASGYRWAIEIDGPHLFNGSSITQGDPFSSDNKTTIRTPIFPPVLGIGKINITVMILNGLIPVDIEQRTAIMLGPFVLFVQ